MEKYLIVGLGNPGLRYRKTRHNMGFMVIDYLSEKYKIKVKKLKNKALMGEGQIDNANVILAKPQTYMNNSGQSIKEMLDYTNIKLDHLIVIYDDMDIELGKIRIRPKGSSGSHNGMKSIIYHIKSEEFMRIRVGIGDKQMVDARSYVLSKIGKSERELAFQAIENSANAITLIINTNINNAMNRYNK